MGKELSEKAALALLKIEKQIKTLYVKRDDLVELIYNKYGTSQCTVKLEGEEKPYVRVKLVDNKERIVEGFYVHSKVNEFEVSKIATKNPPK